MKQAAIAAVLTGSIIAMPIASPAQEIVVGASLVISGPFASYGIDARVGIDVAVDELNAAGGVLGRKIRVEYDDTGGDRAKAVALYRKYAARPEIVTNLSISSSEFVALNPVADEVKMPLISIGSAIPFDKFSPWSFRMNLILDKAMPSVLSQLKELKGAKTLAIIYDTVNNSTVAEMETVKQGLAKAGLELKGVESYSTGEQNFTLQLTRLGQAKPDVIWAASTTDEAALIISQARALGMNSTIVGGAGLNDPRIGALPGKAALGVMTFALFNSADDQPRVRNFIRLYQEKYKKDNPAAYNALGYDTMHLLADAIKRAGSADRDAIRKSLGSTDSFVGADGPFRYSGSGDNLAQAPRLLVYGERGFAPLKR